MAGVATRKEATESEISCKTPETRTDIASHTQKQISINFDESQVQLVNNLSPRAQVEITILEFVATWYRGRKLSTPLEGGRQGTKFKKRCIGVDTNPNHASNGAKQSSSIKEYVS